MSHRISSRLSALAGTSLLAAAALLVAAAPAFAGAGKVTTAVMPLSPNVTYTDSKLTIYVGYTVTIANDPSNTNTINNVVFTATASATDGQEKPTFLSADGAPCTTTNAELTAISCVIGQLRAGQTYPTFAVFFKAPAKITTGTADAEHTDFVNLGGVTYYAEGTGGLQSPPKNSTSPFNGDGTVVPVELGTSNPTNVKSVVPSNKNVVIFTGDDAVTTSAPGHQFSTKVNVPAEPKYTTANITLSEITDPNCTNFTTCYQSDLNIPLPAGVTSYSPYLTIILRMDAANIKKGTKIGGVVVYYQGAPVGDCASPTTPSLPVGTPCIAKRVYYKSSSVPGWTADLDGDFEWQILNTTNGSFKIL